MNDGPGVVLDRLTDKEEESISSIEDIPDEAVPPRMKQSIEAWMLSMSSERRLVSSADKVAEKLTEEHITKILENGARDDERSFSAFKWEKITGFLIFFVSLAFALFLLVFFRDSQYFTTILTAIFSFLGGLGVGKYIIPVKKE